MPPTKPVLLEHELPVPRKLFQIQDDDRPDFVVATNWSNALHLWRQSVQQEDPGSWPNLTDINPKGIQLIADEYSLLIDPDWSCPVSHECDLPDLPLPGSTCWVFDSDSMQPLKLTFLEILPDNWLRFKFEENPGDLGDFIACPPHSWGQQFNTSPDACLKWANQHLEYGC
jgi:hypothetical protein